MKSEILVTAKMTDSPIRAFDADNDAFGIEFQSGKFLFLKPSENVARGSAVIFQNNEESGVSSNLHDALANRDSSLVFLDSEDFDEFLNMHGVGVPTD